MIEMLIVSLRTGSSFIQDLQRRRKKLGSLRLKLRYMEQTVLPLEYYADFVKLLSSSTDEDFFFSGLLGRSCSASEEVIHDLVAFYYLNGEILIFLKKLLSKEIADTENVNILFRENSVATKATDVFMRMIGLSFLKDTIGQHVKSVYLLKQSCEMDPSRFDKKTDPQKNLEMLLSLSEKIWFSIENSVESSPWEIREILYHIRYEVQKKWPTDRNCVFTALSGFLFLRLFCPAILSPMQFSLMSDHPHELVARNLTLISKTLMTFSNLVEFGQKEPYMKEVNVFIRNHLESLKVYLSNMSKLATTRINGENPLSFDVNSPETTVARVYLHFQVHYERMLQLSPNVSLSTQTALELFHNGKPLCLECIVIATEKRAGESGSHHR